MNITISAMVPKKISSLRPSKRKIMKSMYATEQFTRKVQKDLPQGAKGIAQAISEGCNKLRMKMKN